MFCKNCGSPIDDNAAFCPSCAAPQQAAAVAVSGGFVPNAVSQQQEKEMLLAQMNGSLEVMTAMKRLEDEIEKIQAEEIPPLESKSGNVGVLVSVIVAAFFLSMSVVNGVFALIGVLIIVFSVRKRNKFRKKLEETKAKIPPKQAEIETLKNDASLSWLPYDYRDPTYFAMLLGYIQNMRANSLKEAINLLETEMHQARVELMSSISAQASMDASSSANAAAGAAAASAFFSLFK